MPYSLYKTTDDDAKFIDYFSPQLRNFRAALMALFPEREWLTTQIMISLMTGHHLILYGAPGTAKSLIFHTVFDNIVGPNTDGVEKKVFVCQLNPQTTITSLIGAVNVPHFQATGEMRYNVNGHLPDAHYAILEEVFDTGGSTLRALNTILNERKLTEGAMNMDVPLLSAFCPTNYSPARAAERNQHVDLFAFNDRFLCVSEIPGYLSEEENSLDMMENYVVDVKYTLHLQLRFYDLIRMVKLIKGTSQYRNRNYLQVQYAIVNAFIDKVSSLSPEKRTFAMISDRRRNWLTQIVEAYAILQGRSEVYFEDLYGLKYGLVSRPDSIEAQMFDEVATEHIQKAQSEHNEKHEDVIESRLGQIEAQIKALENRLQSGNPVTAKEVGQLLSSLTSIQQELDNYIEPQKDANVRRKTDLLKRIPSIRRDLSYKV